MHTKPTKYVWLMGGFGNVLFQGFAAYVLREQGNSVEMIDNLTRKSLITKILGWSIHDNKINSLLLDGIKTKKTPSIILFSLVFMNKLFGFFSNYICIFEKKKDINNKSIHHFGYFQSVYFLLKNKQNFKSYCLILRNKIIPNVNLENNNSVVIHYRWGDSDWAKENVSYYKSVRECLQKEYQNYEKLVITDDIKAAKSFFSNVTDVKIEKNSVLQDFQKLCSSSIIFTSPSTFSWWASHIGISNLIYVSSIINDKLGVHKDCIKVVL